MSKGWGHQGCHMELWAAVLVPITQPCLTLGDPVDCSPPGSSVHEIFQGKNTGVGCHSLLQGIFPTEGSNLCLLQLWTFLDFDNLDD